MHSEPRRLLVLCDWPLAQRLVEWHLVNLAYNIIGIRFQHKASEREANVTAFGDKINFVNCLVISQGISSTGYDPQSDCSDVVFVEVHSSALPSTCLNFN